MRPRLELPPMIPSRDWKRRVQSFVGSLPEDAGPYSIDVLPRRETASQRQRGYYFAVVVKAYAEFLRGTGMTLPALFGSFEDMAHSLLKQRLLLVAVVDGHGELTHVPGSVARLDVEGMTRLIDDARTYLDDEFGIVTPDPDPTHGLMPTGGAR